METTELKKYSNRSEKLSSWAQKPNGDNKGLKICELEARVIEFTDLKNTQRID